MTIPYSRQKITKEDIKAVQRSLSSDFLTQGPAVPREFENEVCFYIVGAKRGVAVNSATSALHICLGKLYGQKKMT